MDSLPTVVPALWRRMIEAYQGLGAASWALGAGLCALMVLSLFPWPARFRSHARTASIVAIASVVALSVAWAWRLAWLSDDAFISFRYARHLVQGDGLVFNVGERVEGYTNFLWTVLMAAGIGLHIHPGQAAIVLGLASLAGCLVLVWRMARATAPRRSPPTLSIAAVLLGGSYLFASYGTSGLETMMGTFLVLLSLDRALRRAPLSAGLAAVAAVLTRPDLAVFYVALIAAIALDRHRRRELPRLVAPFFAIYVPYFLARWAWYGDLLPNTFYAKSGAGSYLSQGVVYLLTCFLGSGLLGVLPLALVGILHLRRHLLARFALLAVPVYLLYVARIGGDFMFGRLIVPIVPLLALLAEAGARRLVAVRRPVLASLGLVLASLALLPIRLLHTAEKQWLIADERTFYPVTSFSPLQVDSPFFQWADDLIATYGTGPAAPRIATGCVGIVGYRTMAPMLDIFGLTDRHVAHQPITTRGRPGHEKTAAPAWLLERNVDIADVDVYPPEYLRFFSLPSDRIPVRLVRWVPRYVEELLHASPHAVPDFPSYLNGYRPPAGDPERFACDLWFFDEFYFSQQPPEARRRFVDRLVDQGHLDAAAAPFYATGIDEAPAGWTVVDRVRFDNIDRTGWVHVGSAFRVWPTAGLPPGQSEIGHRTDALLDTFSDDEGDRATGSLQSAPFDLRGEIVTLRVGGGLDKTGLAALLVVDGHIIASSTGCNSELLSRRVWDVRAYQGKQARLVVVDNVTAGWGHLIVDDVRQWGRSP